MTRTTSRTLTLSTLACLAPIALGIVLWPRLPEPMPIHWGFDNNPNGWAPKLIALVGLPILMAMLNAFCIWVTERQMPAEMPRPAVLGLLYWSVPMITVSVYAAMLAASLDDSFPVGKVALLILGVLLIVSGNYAPKMTHAAARAIHHPTPADERTWRRRVRVEAYVLVVLGIAALIGMLFV